MLRGKNPTEAESRGEMRDEPKYLTTNMLTTTKLGPVLWCRGAEETSTYKVCSTPTPYAI